MVAAGRVMPGGDDEDPASSRADEQGLKGQQLDSEPNVEENKGGIYPTEDPTVARENIDTNASQVFKDDEDTEVAESEQYHENDDLTETDVSNDLLCAGVKKLIVRSFKRKQRRSTVRKRSLKVVFKLFFCIPRLTEATSHDDFGDAVCKAYSRCSVPYFSEVVNSICKSKNRVELIRSTGFGYMLELDDYLVPRPFAQWIADKVIVEDEEIRIDKKRIPLTAQGVPHVFGIPSGDINISMVDDAGKSEFLAFFGLSDVPTIKFFGSKIIQGEDLSDEQYIRCFMIVVLSTVLCPTSNTKPSTKYMGSLIDVKKIRDLNWCKFTHMWLMQAIRKYQKDKSKHDRLTLTLGGCIYQLTVCFLDFTDFGAIQIPPVMPRICIWKGSMVKNFSDMLIGENGMYRPSKIKDESETCYAQESFSWASTTKNSNLRCAIDRTVGKSLPEQVKDDIFNSFQFYMKDENVSTCMKAKNLLLKTLQLVTSANVDSEHTLKVESSENNHNSVEEQHWSGSTVKVNSDGDYVEDDGTALDRRVKRMKQISQQSPVSIESDRRNHKQDKSQGNRGEGDDAIGSTKSVDAYNQGNNGNEQIEDNKKGEGMEPEEVRENTSKDDTKVLQARQQVSKRDGVQRETKVTSEHDAVEANIKETRAPSTSSFEYLLEAKNSTVLRQIQGKEAGKRNAPSFAGFTNQKTCTDKHLSQDKNNTNVINQGNKGSCSKIDFDINVTLTAGDNDSNDYETVKEVADNIETNEDVSWATYLDKAREKYFFHEDDTPTIRLFENWDDCGNEITEPELWRPLHMNDEDYNRKIENAKKSIVHQNIELGQTSKYKQTQEIKCSEVSVHCAQQAKSVAQICFSPRPLTALTPDGGIIDLTSPNANIHHGWTKAHTCYSPRNRNTTFRTTSTTPPSSKIFFSKAALTGRILFPEGANSECNLDGTENSPITFLDHNAASPDVQILSHRSFKQSCSNAVNRSDYHYNTKLMLGSTSSSYGKENIPPKRIVQPSKYLCSPYENQDRGPIMEHEVKLYKNILVLSENDYYKSKIGIEMDRCVVSLEQLGNSFRPGGWVEEYVINAYCRKLFNDNHPRISQRHYFFHIAAWKTEDGRLTFKDKALNSFNGSGKARPLELSNELFFPTIHKRHWFVFLVDLKARMFIFLDSKYEENSMFHKSIKHMMIRNFIQTWCDSHLKNMGFSQYQTAYPVLPKQDDCDACGIFTIMKMQNYRARNPL